jgi:protein phosphatase
VDPDIFQQQLQSGDILLLCSDGLWEMVHDSELTRVLGEQQDPQKTCDSLIDMANANGGEDNITAVIVHIS